MASSKNKGLGPHSPSVVEGGERLTNIRIGSAEQPNLDLKNNPNDEVARKIRGMKFSRDAPWKPNMETAVKSVK